MPKEVLLVPAQHQHVGGEPDVTGLADDLLDFVGGLAHDALQTVVLVQSRLVGEIDDLRERLLIAGEFRIDLLQSVDFVGKNRHRPERVQALADRGGGIPDGLHVLVVLAREKVLLVAACIEELVVDGRGEAARSVGGLPGGVEGLLLDHAIAIEAGDNQVTQQHNAGNEAELCADLQIPEGHHSLQEIRGRRNHVKVSTP